MWGAYSVAYQAPLGYFMNIDTIPHCSMNLPSDFLKTTAYQLLSDIICLSGPLALNPTLLAHIVSFI